jgi:hypothetical protein
MTAEAQQPQQRIKGLAGEIVSAVASAFDIQAQPSEWHRREFGAPRLAASLLLYKYARLDFGAIGQTFSVTNEDSMKDVYRAQSLVQTMPVFKDVLAAATIDVLDLPMQKPDLKHARSLPLV